MFLVPYPCQPYCSIPCTLSCPPGQASLPVGSHSACWSLAPPSVYAPIHLCISPAGARDTAVGCLCPVMELAPAVPFSHGLLPGWHCCTNQDDTPHTYSLTLQCVKWWYIHCLFLGHGKIIIIFRKILTFLILTKWANEFLSFMLKTIFLWHFLFWLNEQINFCLLSPRIYFCFK